MPDQTTLPDGVVAAADLSFGVWKYVIVWYEVQGATCQTARFAPIAVEHAKMVRAGERAAAAGFIAMSDDGGWCINSAISESLGIKGDMNADAVCLARIIGSPPFAIDMKPTKPSTPTRFERKATACIDYDEAKSLATTHGLRLAECLDGEALLIPTTGVKLVFQTRRAGWMLYGYADDGADIVETLRAIVAHGRVKIEGK